MAPDAIAAVTAIAPDATAAMAPAENVGTSGGQKSTTFSSTTADFPNPDRGFYSDAGSDFVTSYDAGSVQAAYNRGQRLVLARILLSSYRTSDLPASFLYDLSRRFAQLRSAGMKATVLFAYDFTARGNDTSAARIKRHLEQLQPVLAANADLIPYMRAGFIGAWGEWHSSKSGNSCGYNSGSTSCATADANRLIVRDALLANVPSSTQIGFRAPGDLAKWYPSPAQQTRAGVHNDCFLAGPSDSGTYANKAERTYTKTLTGNTAFGGETCEGAETPVRNTCNDILNEGAQYHLAWLNSAYAPSVLNAWKAGGCYAQVSRLMGYRLQLDGLSHAAQVVPGGSVAVTVSLRNVGWARVFSPRKLVVTFRHKTSGATIFGAAGNLQALAPQATGTTQVNIGVTIPPSAQSGSYDVYISAPDVFASTEAAPGFAVRFANKDNAALGQTWSATTARFRAGTTLTVG